MNIPKATPLMKQACAQAETVLHIALDAVDAALREDGCAIENQQLVAAFMNVAGAAYTALTIREAIDHFIEFRKRFEARTRWRVAARWRDLPN